MKLLKIFLVFVLVIVGSIILWGGIKEKDFISVIIGGVYCLIALILIP